MDLPPAIKSWRLNAAKQQQTFYSLLADRQWDQLDRNHKYFKSSLKTKISLALFAETFSKCSPSQQTRINSTLETCLQLTGSADKVHLGYTYVHIFGENKRERILPLIRVKSKYEKNYFVEIIQPGKIYENWDNFLQCNNISASYICYPKNGLYERQSDKLVSLEYNKTPKKDEPIANDLPVTVFFPFYKNLHKAGIYPSTELTHIMIDRKPISRDPLYEVNDKYIFAEWLKNMNVGDVGTDAEYFTSMMLEPEVYYTAVRYFKCVYNTSSRTNSHKFIFTLMTVLFKQKIGKCKQEDYNDFLAGLNFFLNMTAEMNFIKELVVKLNERPLYLQHFFTASNQMYEHVKKLEFVHFNQKPAIKLKCGRNVFGGTCYALVRISDMDEIDNHFISYPAISQKIVDYIKSHGGSIESNSSVEFWFHVSSNLHVIFLEYLNKVLEDDYPTQRLKELWDQVAFPKREFSTTISEYSSPSLARKILQILDRINSNLNMKTYFMKEYIKVQLLEYVIELSQHFNCQGDERFADICAMVVEKFITWFDCMAVESKSKKRGLDISDLELITGRIFAELNKSSVIKQLQEDYKQLYEINRVSYLGEPALATNDMELYYFRMPQPFEEDDLSITNIIVAMNYLVGKDDRDNGHTMEHLPGILRVVYKSTMILMFRKHEGNRVFGFFLKIRLPIKC